MSGVYGYSNDPTATTGSVGTGGGAGGVNVSEGATTVPALNNAHRGSMADQAMYRNDTGGKLTTGGSANAYTVALESAPTVLTLADGISFKAIIHVTNTGATTINVSTQGAKKVLYKGAVLSGGELVADQVYSFAYDASADGGAGAWLLENPSPVAASLPSYDTDDISNASTVDGGAGTLTEVLEGIESDVQAIVAGVSASYDTFAEVETKFGTVDADLSVVEAELDEIMPQGASGPFRYPPMTTTEINALTGMAQGDKVRNTTEDEDWEYDGSAWGKIASGDEAASGDLQSYYLNTFPTTGWTPIEISVSSSYAGGVALPGTLNTTIVVALSADKIVALSGNALDTDPGYVVTPSTGVVTTITEPSERRNTSPIALRLDDDRLMIVSGRAADDNAWLTSCEIYTLSTNSWATTGALPVSLYGAGGVLADDGNVYLFGGRLSSGSDQRNIYKYTTSTGVWSDTGVDTAVDRYNFSGSGVCNLPSGKILICGGTAVGTFQIYDPVANSITTETPTNDSTNYAAKRFSLGDQQLSVIFQSNTWYLYDETADALSKIGGGTAYYALSHDISPSGALYKASGTTLSAYILKFLARKD